MARSLDARMARLAAQLQARQPSWTSDVEAVRARAAARVKLKIGELLGAEWHPAVKSAREILRGDTPAQGAADLETLQRWGRQHPEALDPDEDRCARFIQKLEEMARRLEAHHEPGTQDQPT